MKKNETPEIHQVKLSELVIDPAYSGRSAKEIKDNAKELAPMLAQGWDASQPGAYFVAEDGKKHLLAGFTRCAAAELCGLKHGYFVEKNGDSASHLTECIRTNAGKPISRKAQGAIFAQLRDGLVADDFAGTVADPNNPADWKRRPMSEAEIAELPGVGKTAEHVRQCIGVFESPMFEQYEEQISFNAFISAQALANKHHDGSDAKLEKIIKAAIRVAEAEGKTKATPKHFDAIKKDFIPIPKETAVSSEAPTPKPESKKSESQSPATEDQGDPEPEPEQEIPSLDLPESKTPTKKAQKTIRAALITFLLEYSEIDDDLAERIADGLIDRTKLIVSDSPF